MSIPATTYDIATITNPSSALTDFTLIVDLSRMSSAWWSAVNASDGTRGRASKSDGTTELACDWIDFNDTAETGLVRVKWTGILASSGTQQIRIYPPNTTNTAYGVSDTYGQYNAYDSELVFYAPDGGDINRTDSGFTVSAVGTQTAGGAIGPLGDATQINDSNGWDFDTSPSNSQPELTASAIVNIDTMITRNAIFDAANGSSYRFSCLATGSPTFRLRPSDGLTHDIANVIEALQWEHVVYSYSSINQIQSAYRNGELTNSEIVNGGILKNDHTNDFIGHGSDGSELTGRLQHFALYHSQPNASFIKEEYSQTNDNATFWGTWTNVPVGSEVSINPTINEPENITASLLTGKSIIATITESESIEASLLTAKIITAIVNEPETITATLLTESTTQEVIITPVVNESESITCLLLSAKEIRPIVNESETITAVLKNRLPLFPVVNESETVTALLLIDGVSINIDTLTTTGIITRKLSTLGTIERKLSTSGIITRELQTIGTIQRILNTSGDLQ